MFTWLQRLFSSRPQAPELPGETAHEELPPAWAAGLAEALQKSARAQARLALQVEDLDHKLEGGLAELRSSLSSRNGAAPGVSSGTEPRWNELLDALDLLEEAIRLADPPSASGLEGVKSRLVSFLEHSGLTRMAPLGQPPDGRFFRVVGTEPHPNLAEGAVVRLVRAAVLREGHLLREGEAITVRNPS
jgi:molecular chaperone GrpE (heat shock protein)